MFFFFKQKTAYELRISDWSSDVCSSDLVMAVGRAHRKDGDVAWLHGFAAVILDQHGLAGQHDNELVFILMPVALGGRRAGRQDDLAGAEILELRRVADTAIPETGNLRREGFGGAGPVGRFDPVEVELGDPKLRW